MPLRSVWIINHYAQPPSLPGGTRHYELAKRLIALGMDVSIIASQFHHATQSHGERASGHVEMIDGVRFVWIPARIGYKGNSLARMFNMLEFAWRARARGRRCFKEQLPHPDVIVGSTPHLLAAMAAAMLSTRWRARFILEIRDLWPDSLVALGGYASGHPLILFLRVVERWLYRRADHIVSLLPEAWRYLQSKGVAKQRVTWIANGGSVATPRALEKSNDDALRAVYIGAHGRANVLDDLLSAAAILEERHASIRIVLIGDGPLKQALIQRARTENLRNVEFRNTVPKKSVPVVLQEADVAIALMESSPLYQYGISLNKLFDAFAAGTPVLFAGNVAHDYVALSGAGLTVAPRCPECIANGLIKMATMEPSERIAMGERGRDYLRVHHDWDVLADRFHSVLMGPGGLGEGNTG
ncbi:glycosyltransferase family 4 protein [Candidatus Bipolaricaulota bacterium]|nr:glycosyltransferase family 4 protein [Candidatus Bipolaricaulota bacterium]